MQLNQNRLFITGTDTDIGKTLVSSAILFKKNQQQKTIGLKPISTGAEVVDNKFQQADTIELTKHSSCKLPHEQVNPWCYKTAISPHIAAKESNQAIDLSLVTRHLNSISQQFEDHFILAEGAGGICCPINDQDTMLDLMQQLDWPVLLVVGLKLGCLNHAMLTIDKLANSKVSIAGWITTEVAPIQAKQENLARLKKIIAAPHLGDIPYLTNAADTAKAAKHIEI